ncbi:Protein N-acetyltransferase, RimJ/RimL family [Jatrophihabitans endophyticus]|uniref:Protein N-acetyltransferase, RimJ/RimL family n=1 Tax=Jatrophihabitans endophyticus TaxID=1206085 RepID=A0A1M5LWH8_9ACTN|nr:GNAT family protein [Jatrophihabitans endophyticus]SHG68723.1 Protein N-acetyltransferase, RimJ/RimL family [Jatrophihabitans endophyticus]
MTRTDEWYSLPVLTGSLIRLEPLAVEHVDGYLAAARDDEEVLRWVNTPGSSSGAIRTRDDARADVLAALAARARGQRLAYAQLDAGTGEFAGTTSLYELDPAARALAIGSTWLARRHWRRGHNTESKLLLLTHAFEGLGAARVVWHTDIRNERSQAAIARLGATREGELRKHRIRRDGSWRTTVQYSMTDDDWPAARDRLSARLARG